MPSAEETALVREAQRYLRSRYAPSVHHAACVVRCGAKMYYGLHIDTSGFDICAETVALGSAMADGQTRFDAIVTVLRLPQGIEVVNPCGNCRQLLLEHAPDIRVLTTDGTRLRACTPAALLPTPYISARGIARRRRG